MQQLRDPARRTLLRNSGEIFLQHHVLFHPSPNPHNLLSIAWSWLDILDIHFKGIKEEDGAQEVATGFPSSDNAEESTVARYNATVAELARLCLPENTGLPPSQVSLPPIGSVAL